VVLDVSVDEEDNESMVLVAVSATGVIFQVPECCTNLFDIMKKEHRHYNLQKTNKAGRV
jgi:hypothetical protein